MEQELIIAQIINNFDFAYMLSINTLTYIIIKIIDELNKDKAINTWAKRGVLIGVIIVITLLYYFTGYERWTILINSACVTPVVWSWIFRPIVTKLGINYKKKLIN